MLQSTIPPVPALLVPSGDDHGDLIVWLQSLPRSWYPVRSWGSAGWELGCWPLIAVAHYDKPTAQTFGYAQWVEGDANVRMFATREERDAFTDAAAAWWWRHGQARGPADLADNDEDLRPEHKGSFPPF